MRLPVGGAETRLETIARRTFYLLMEDPYSADGRLPPDYELAELAGAKLRTGATLSSQYEAVRHVCCLTWAGWVYLFVASHISPREDSTCFGG